MELLTILWGIFTIIFFLLAIFHILMMRKEIKHFKTPTLTEIKFGEDAKKLPMSFWDKPLQALQKQINDFFDDFNRDNKRIHFISACGYLAAALTAGISLLLTLID